MCKRLSVVQSLKSEMDKQVNSDENGKTVCSTQGDTYYSQFQKYLELMSV